MKPIYHLLSDVFQQAIFSAFGFEAEPSVAVAQNPKFGDYQCNAAMGLVRRVAEASGEKVNPRQVAEKIKSAAEPLLVAASGGIVDSAEDISIAGPGFINVRLSKKWLAAQLGEALADDERLGLPVRNEAQMVVVDYSGPNIAKQMHVGHLRSTIIGDCIARVLEFQGDRVLRQNHLGDWGTQFGMLIAHLRTTAGAGADAAIDDLEGFYRHAKERFDSEPGFQDEARATVVKLQSGGEEELALWAKIVDETRRHFQPVYERLGVSLTREHERGESFYNQFLADVVALLLEKGVAQRSEGAVVVFTEGFESPLIVEKSGGGYLYGTTDLAAIRYRSGDLGANRVIYVHDSRQGQHFAQVFDAARRAGWADGVALEYAPFGTMLGNDGRPFKTRSGETVKLKDLLDEAEQRAFDLVSEKNPTMAEQQRREIAGAVGIGAVKYADLSKDRTGDYVFTWEKMMSMDGNTGPYLQYALTRIKSIFRKAASAAGNEPVSAAGDIVLSGTHEAALALQILKLGDVLDVVDRELKPHHLCSYLYDLATVFNGFYENCPVLQSEGAVRLSRLALCSAAARTMETGLELLGIPRLEQM
jgi:arginyl-tRNA synthetase